MQNKFNLDAKSKWSQCKINLISMQNQFNLNAKSEWSQCKKQLPLCKVSAGAFHVQIPKIKYKAKLFIPRYWKV
jgi:hypothetical protein